MPTKLTADYADFPECIQKALPYIIGETLELRSNWEVYSHLFMEEESFTELLADKLGGILGYFQGMLQDELFMSISRLTDKYSKSNRNLSIAQLIKSVEYFSTTGEGERLKAQIEEIFNLAENIRKHRNKRIGHFDYRTSINELELPMVRLSEIKEVIVKFEEVINILYWEFSNTTMIFDNLSAYDITGRAERTCYHALILDQLIEENQITKKEIRKRISDIQNNKKAPPAN